MFFRQIHTFFHISLLVQEQFIYIFLSLFNKNNQTPYKLEGAGLAAPLSMAENSEDKCAAIILIIAQLRLTRKNTHILLTCIYSDR